MGDILVATADSTLRNLTGIEQGDVWPVWRPRWSISRMLPATSEQLGVADNA